VDTKEALVSQKDVWKNKTITGFRYFPEHYSGTRFSVEMQEINFAEGYEDANNDLFLVLENIQRIVERIFQYFCLMAQGLEAESKTTMLNTLMSAIRHEMGQIYAGHLTGLTRYDAMVAKNNGLVREDAEKLIENTKAYAHSTMLRIASSRYLAALIPEPKRELFYPYEKILYKWRSIAITQMHEIPENKWPVWLELDKVSKSDASRPKMWADPDMVEQIAFNLINNAIKYALAGTRVFVDCQLGPPVYRNGMQINVYELIVSNYAAHQQDMNEETLFDFASRGKAVRTIAGSGLGLWFAREFARKHGGTLKAKIEPISKYNILTLKRLFEKDSPGLFLPGISKAESQAAKEAAQLLKESRDVWDMIDINAVRRWNQNRFENRKKTEKYRIQRELFAGTDWYTFTLRLPQITLKENESIENLEQEESE
jgi:signal transduction histidine kinase